MGVITKIQFDPNGYCNSKCWYCPVKYEALPAHKNMNPDNVAVCFDKILSRRGHEVGDDLFVYTAHYNEILLYPYFSEFLEILRERKLKTMVLSNGTTLTMKNWELMNEYSDVVYGVNLNVPACSLESWTLQTGFSEKKYYRMHNVLEFIHKNSKKIDFSIGMNGTSSTNLVSNMEKFPKDVSEEIHEQEFQLMKEKYPKFNTYKNSHLVDRNGIMEKHKVYSVKMGVFLKCQQGRSAVVDCDRFENWLHINCYGDVFVCCNDYHYDYVFGNLLTQSLEEIWNSKKRQAIIQKSKENICKNCPSAIWE